MRSVAVVVTLLLGALLASCASGGPSASAEGELFGSQNLSAFASQGSPSLYWCALQYDGHGQGMDTPSWTEGCSTGVCPSGADERQHWNGGGGYWTCFVPGTPPLPPLTPISVGNTGSTGTGSTGCVVGSCPYSKPSGTPATVPQPTSYPTTIPPTTTTTTTPLQAAYQVGFKSGQEDWTGEGESPSQGQTYCQGALTFANPVFQTNPALAAQFMAGCVAGYATNPY